MRRRRERQLTRWTGMLLAFTLLTAQLALSQARIWDNSAGSQVGTDIISYWTWEFIMIVTASIFLLGMIGMFYLYGFEPWERLMRRFWPHKVGGLFLRTEIQVMRPSNRFQGSELEMNSMRSYKDPLVGYLTSLSFNAAKVITDEKLPVGSRVFMKFHSLPEYWGEDKDLYGVVRSSHLHVNRGSFYETKVELKAIAEEHRDGFASFLDTLESNYSAA